MAVRIQMRRDTQTNWSFNNPILAEGEMGLETGTDRWKIGNGILAWNDLSYANSIFSGPSVISDDGSGTALRITQTGSGNAFLVEDSSNPDATPFIITGDGNIGIGTQNPNVLLDVNGNTVISDNSSNAALKIVQDGSGPALYIEDISGDTSPFVVNSSGSVGIGTDSPIAALDVNGNARISGQLSANNGAIVKNINAGITSENTIDTLSGDLILDSASGKTSINDNVVIDGTVQFGSTADINNQDIINIDSAAFNLSTTDPGGIGKLYWNDADGTLNLGLKGGNSVLQLGQETLAYCYNAESTALANGTVVYVYSSNAGKISVKRAKANSESTSLAFGIVTEPINAGANGFVTIFGLVRGLNTQGYATGSQIYLDPTTAGAFTTIKPTQPNHIVTLGFIATSDPSSGTIFINVDNGFELDELHNILLSSVEDKDTLSFDNASGLWKNKSILTAITEVDGPDSGIDADLLDGQHGSYYAPIDSPEFNGNVTTTGTNRFVGHGAIYQVTSSTRPISPEVGDIIYETDTMNFLGWNGISWNNIGGAGISYDPDARAMMLSV